MNLSYELISTIIVAVVQGITEWFPISSDGHLIIADRLLGRNPDFVFDVALHFGTLMAVFVYFGKDIIDILQDLLKGKWSSEKSRLGFLIVVGTIPVVIFGLLLRNIVEQSYLNLEISAFGFGITSILLFIAAYYKPKKEFFLGKLSYKNAFLIGCAQVAALLPGISRSGTTLVAGILLGLKIRDSAKFSFLLSIPAVLGANVLVMGNKTLPAEFILPTLISFVVGIFTIFLLYQYAFNDVKNLKWFALYALIIAISTGIWSLVI